MHGTVFQPTNLGKERLERWKREKLPKEPIGLTGLVSIITVLGSLAYVDKKLHDVSNGYKYGPARHLEYLSALLHSFSRSIDVIAADTHRKVCDEENRKYDRLEDERERAWSAAR